MEFMNQHRPLILQRWSQPWATAVFAYHRMVYASILVLGDRQANDVAKPVYFASILVLGDRQADDAKKHIF